MASASTSGFGPGLYDDGRQHPVWNSLAESRRRRLVKEDLLAGRSVAGVLVGVVTFGVLLGITAVLIACL